MTLIQTLDVFVESKRGGKSICFHRKLWPLGSVTDSRNSSYLSVSGCQQLSSLSGIAADEDDDDESASEVMEV